MDAADAEFLRSFEDTSLPLEHWNHRAHLRISYLYLRAHGFEGALERMRAGVQRFNNAKGIEDKLHSGYHETVTGGWLRLLNGLMRAHGTLENHDAFYARHSYLNSKMALLLYYSRDRIMSREAKHGFLEPDLAAFPRPPTSPA